MDKTGTVLAVLTALYGCYIAVALLLARVRDFGWRARPRARRKTDGLATNGVAGRIRRLTQQP
jgi:hypothetical protein